MKILFDTNVLVDIALERQPFVGDSEQLLSLAEARQFEGFISASTISDLYYIIRKAKGHSLTLEFLSHMIAICQIATVDRAAITMALTLSFADFEDAIQYSTAVVNSIEAIVTRNLQDYSSASLTIYTPTALIQALSTWTAVTT